MTFSDKKEEASMPDKVDEVYSVKLDKNDLLYVPPRVVPVPDTISEAAQEMIGKRIGTPWEEAEEISLEFFTEKADDLHSKLSDAAAEIYEVQINRETIAGVECSVITPDGPLKTEKVVLVNICAGMGLFGNKNLIEAIPIAKLLNIKVIKPDYRKHVDHPVGSGLEDILFVYEDLLNCKKYEKIGMYGTSNGADMVFQTVSKLISQKMPVPDALVAWGGGGATGWKTDSMVTNRDLDASMRTAFWKFGAPMTENLKRVFENISFQQQKFKSDDPVVYPIRGDLSLFPPALLTAGTRDFALSSVVLMHRELKKARVEAELVLFEAMSHFFPFYSELPEAQELYEHTAEFFTRKLKIGKP